MPPRSALTGSFSVTDVNNEVVCPLKNHDGSSCRKRCIGEKRYRSMQEHIRRAHPEHYIPKLPATEESFLMMINTTPSERPLPPSSSSSNAPLGAIGLFETYPRLPPAIDLFEGHGGDVQPYFRDDFVYPGPGSNRSSDEYRRGSLLNAANAAEALAQLHDHRRDHPFDNDQDIYSDNEIPSERPRPHFTSFQSDQAMFDDSIYPSPNPPRPRELLPSSLSRSPPYYRSSTLPPAPRPTKPNRPRKNSIGQSGRLAKHERKKSKEIKRLSYERNAMSAEPQAGTALYDKRWQDLIEAAASATEEDSRDLTPVSALFRSPTITPSTSFTSSTGTPVLPPFKTTLFAESSTVDPRLLHPQVPGSPHTANRASLPPFLSAFGPSNHSYTASPLARALTPPPPDLSDLAPFPSVESSSLDSSGKSGGGGGQAFHMSASGLSDASPSYAAPPPVRIYCAGCRKLAPLADCYACTECICGLCKDCVDALSAEQTRGRFGARCPRCAAVGGRFKPFQLDIR